MRFAGNARFALLPRLAAAAGLHGAGARARPATAPAAGRARAAPRGLRPQARPIARQRVRSSARGRILYDFSGNACEGYALQFRQVSELDSGEGKVRSATCAPPPGRTARRKRLPLPFAELSRRDAARSGRRPGRARSAGSRGQADQAGATRSSISTPTIVFPTEHMRRIIAAAREGKTDPGVPVYDGSDTGEKVYNTLTVIGQAIAPDERMPTDAAAGQQALAALTRWPVTISYFDKAARPAASRRRSMPSLSSSTRTACRARCCSTTTISSSAAR